MKPNPMDMMLTKTKDLKSNVLEKTKDIGLEITRAFTHSHQPTIQNKVVYAATLLIVGYFACMDFLTYLHIQNMPVRKKDPTPFVGGFDYFEMLSVKGMMEDQLSAHFIWPTCELLEIATNISQSAHISPSGVSIFGAVIAIPAAKLLSMESLPAKRISILIFLFRVWLDGLDGIVYRMQHLTGAAQHTQQSARHTSGWLIDFFCDTFAALMFLVGVFYTVKQSVPSKHPVSVLGILPLTCPPNRNNHGSAGSSPRPSSPSLERSDREFSLRAISIKLVWVTLTILAGSGMWDYFVAQYRAVFEITLPTPEQQILQSKIMKSGSTFMIFWFWRVLNGVSLINTAYIAVVYDKMWEYLHYLQFFGTSSLLVLGVMTLLHLNSVSSALGL